MAEQLTLASPQQPPAPPAVLSYVIKSVFFDWEDGIIKIAVRDSTGKIHRPTYADRLTPSEPTTIATDLMRALNKLDLSTKSLHKRLLERLVADGKLPAGNVTGAPD